MVTVGGQRAAGDRADHGPHLFDSDACLRSHVLKRVALVRG
ncbi:hypothetical protein STVIR_0639 [Streptomyces viridochromogenes Tue57]|uniref:Uncharacterized protein n=1 Tax=Streptomyces viridochromogenes Tue57 TaxID=1160705 RepID=L8PSL3_STRVR|nr:hypothetical protein STVIR_0639 [Streptomyces viridochromogenes Tue57]